MSLSKATRARASIATLPFDVGLLSLDFDIPGSLSTLATFVIQGVRVLAADGPFCMRGHASCIYFPLGITSARQSDYPVYRDTRDDAGNSLP